VPTAPAALRYAGYSEPHHAYGNDRPGQAILVAATPDTDPTAPWRLASEEIKQRRGSTSPAPRSAVSPMSAATAANWHLAIAS
jgi:hypothetical protein